MYFKLKKKNKTLKFKAIPPVLQKITEILNSINVVKIFLNVKK